MSNTDQLIKSYQDFLKIEKELRNQAESNARGMADLLKTLAWRLNEPLMKSIVQNQEPEAPNGWTLSRWSWFFQQSNPETGVPPTWNIPREQLNLVARLEEEQKRLEACFRELDRRAITINEQAATIARLEEDLRKAQKGSQGSSQSSNQGSNQSSAPRAKNNGVPDNAGSPSAPAKAPSQIQKALGNFPVDKIANAMKSFPSAISGRFSEGEQSRRRQLSILSLVGINGTSTRHEIYRNLCQNLPDAGINGVRDALSASNFSPLFNMARFSVFKTPGGNDVALDVITLSPDGEEACRALNWGSARQSEWSRLLKANAAIVDKEKRQHRCAATLLLMAHARARNYTTYIASLKSQTARPDIQVQAGTVIYRVNLFVDPEEENYKAVIANMAANSPDGSVSFCTIYRADREKVSAFCRSEKIPGCCTDLASLVTNENGHVLEFLNIDAGSDFWRASLSDKVD